MKKFLPLFSLFTLLFISSSWALSAFQARAIAEKMLDDQARGKLIKIVGKRGPGAEPATWSFIFYDPFADQNGRMITVFGNAVTEIRDGYTELGSFRITAYKEDEIIPGAQLKIDSDRALEEVKKTAEMERVHLNSVSYVLEKSKSNGMIAPVWALTLYGDQKGSNEKIGSAKVSAETGQIFELKLDYKKITNSSDK